MKIYAISGLGADERVFKYLKLNYSLIPIKWIAFNRNESIKDYTERLSKNIDTTENFAILGVSFGGVIAVEMSKLLTPCITILISSVETNKELRPIFRGIGKLGLLNHLPVKVFDPPRKLARFLFGTTKRELLNSILDDTNLEFSKWAINELSIWQNEKKLKNILRIHGTNDKLIPWDNGSSKVQLIEDDGHFMIVDRSKEISEIINEEIMNYID